MDKLDYLPEEIMDCLKNESSYPTFDKDRLLVPNKKKQNTIKESKILKLPKYFDISTMRGEQIERLNVTDIKEPCIESIIPEKYWIRKEDLKKFLEYNERELKSLEEGDQNQISFPTKHPRDRYEVKCLERTLQQMLDDNGRPDSEFINMDIQSQDDIDLLLNHVMLQEDVLNVILHELGRQMSTMSTETGATVMELRKMYTDLLNKMPVELMRLKADVKEQVVRDEKLLTQIEDFQSGIIYLTDRLRDIKNQDIKVTKNADTLQRELEAAVHDSARSKELLNEYHVLYDLQRQRLDHQMSSINIEKEEWSSLAFALALKISDESLLNTTRRLRLTTKKLIQLSQHFAIYISDRDTVITTKVQDVSDQYLKMATFLYNRATNVTNRFVDLYQFLKKEFDVFTKKKILESRDQLNEVVTQINSLQGFLGHEDLKAFMSDISPENVANYDADIGSMTSLIDDLESLIKLLSDRRAFQTDQSDDISHVMDFIQLFADIRDWNGLIVSKLKIVSTFQHFLADFQSKIHKIETEMANLITDDNEDVEIDLDNIPLLISELYIETFEIKEFNEIAKNEDFTSFIQFSNKIEKTMEKFRNQIDGFDSRMMEEISCHQETITRWLVDIIFLLSNMVESNDLEVKYRMLCDTFGHVISLNGRLCEYVMRYSEEFIAMSATTELASKQLEIEEYQKENSNWSEVAEILIRNIGEKIEQELLKRKRQSESTPQRIDMDNIEELLNEIAAKTTDNNIYLSVKSVRNLKSELESAEKRILDANESRNGLLVTLEGTLDEVKEYESKIEALTVEYCEYTRL